MSENGAESITLRENQDRMWMPLYFYDSVRISKSEEYPPTTVMICRKASGKTNDIAERLVLSAERTRALLSAMEDIETFGTN